MLSLKPRIAFFIFMKRKEEKRMTDILSLSLEGDALTAALHGELDHHSAVIVREKIDEALYLHRPKRLIIDIGRVDFMDSSGLGLIMGRLAKATELGTELAVADPTPRAARMLKMAGLDRFIQNERK